MELSYNIKELFLASTQELVPNERIRKIVKSYGMTGDKFRSIIGERIYYAFDNTYKFAFTYNRILPLCSYITKEIITLEELAELEIAFDRYAKGKITNDELERVIAKINGKVDIIWEIFKVLSNRITSLNDEDVKNELFDKLNGLANYYRNTLKELEGVSNKLIVERNLRSECLLKIADLEYEINSKLHYTISDAELKRKQSRKNDNQ